MAQARKGSKIYTSMWWSLFIELKAAGCDIQLVTPKEGYRGLYGGLGISKHLSGPKLEAAKAQSITINYQPSSSPADVALFCFLNQPNLFHTEYARSLVRNYRGFSFYWGAHGQKRSFPTISVKQSRLYSLSLMNGLPAIID